MNLFFILLNKLAVMFLFMAVGTMLFRKGKITEAGSASLGNILIYLVLPCVILNGFCVERTTVRLQGLLISIVLSVILLTCSILVSRLVFYKDPIAHFAAAFANPGFFGIPLILAALGEDSVFYVAPFIACLNILQWTYGVSCLKGEKIRFDFKKIIASPFMISFLLGLLLFCTQWQIPGILKDVITSATAVNTPLAMIICGIYIAKVDWKKVIIKKELYLVSLLRLLVAPAIAFIILWMVPNRFYDLKLCLFIVSSCPVGTNVAVYAQLHNKDYEYAAQTVVISTILSAVTIPLLTTVVQNMWMLS